jgi:hypothetical protein
MEPANDPGKAAITATAPNRRIFQPRVLEALLARREVEIRYGEPPPLYRARG